MKKRSVLAVSILALLLSLVLIVPAAAIDGIGFNIDCEGAEGYGSVLAGEWAAWDIYLWDPVTGAHYLTGPTVVGPADFDPVVPWPVEIIPGTGPDTSYYEIYINNCLVQVGHFECEPEPPCGWGCTPGYWKQEQHFDSWVPTGFAPGDNFDTVFGGDYFDPDITLLEALKLKGGGFNALARHAVAALLNASHPDVDYDLTDAEVIALLQGGTEANKDILEYNNELGCPLD